jgi:hypothetical protein
MNDPAPILSRRHLLHHCGAGLGMTALSCLLHEQGLLGAEQDVHAQDSLAPRRPHFSARASSVIWIFVNGGHSQVDTWDYKPELARRDGSELKGFDKFTGFFSNQVGPLMKSPFEFKQYGESGKWVSSIFPQLSKHVDKMAFLHSLYSESNNHSPALFMMNSGLPRMGFPRSAPGSPTASDRRTGTCQVLSLCPIPRDGGFPRGTRSTGVPVSCLVPTRGRGSIHRENRSRTSIHART